MSDELKVIESKFAAQSVVIESLIKHLSVAKLIDAEELIADIKKAINAPISINADPTNINTMRYELSNWQDTILHIMQPPQYVQMGGGCI